MQQFVEIARDRLHLKINDPHGPSAWRQYLLAFHQHCKANPRTLIIMDNVRDPARLNSNGCLETAFRR